MVSFVGIYSLSGSYFDLFANDLLRCIGIFSAENVNSNGACYSGHIAGWTYGSKLAALWFYLMVTGHICSRPRLLLVFGLPP